MSAGEIDPTPWDPMGLGVPPETFEAEPMFRWKVLAIGFLPEGRKLQQLHRSQYGIEWRDVPCVEASEPDVVRWGEPPTA